MNKELFIIFGLIFILRIPSLYQPILDMDESVFSEFANIVLDGGKPYIDAFDNKPPLTYCFFSLVYLVSGKNNLLAVHFVTMLIVITTAFFIYFLCREFYDEKTGFAAALLFAALAHVHEPKYISTNSETLMNLPLIISAFLFLKHNYFKKNTVLPLIFSGICLGTAFMINYKAGILAGVFLLYTLIKIFLYKNEIKHKIIMQVFLKLGVICAGTLSVLLIISAFFYFTGNINEYIKWGFFYNFKYIGSGSETFSIIKPLSRTAFFILLSMPVWILIIISFIKNVRNILKQSYIYLFSIIWLIFSFYAVLLGGRTYSHYFIQLIPPLSLLGGIAYSELITSRKGIRIIILIFFTVMVGVSFIARINVKETYELVNYPNHKADTDYELVGGYINRHSLPGDMVYAWGWATPVYYHSGRRCATRFLISDYVSGRIFGTENNSAAVNTAIPDELRNFFIADLKKNMPLYFIDTSPADHYGYSRFPISGFPELKNYVRENYVKEESINCIDIYKKKEI